MTKYFMAFAFLLVVTLGNSYFSSSKQEKHSKLAQQQAEQQKRQQQAQPVQDKAAPEKIAKVSVWKETEYQQYNQFRKERLEARKQAQAQVQKDKKAEVKKAAQVASLDASALSESKSSKELTRRNQARKKAASDKIEYVKVPFKGSYILVSRDYYKVNGKRMPLTRKQAEEVARKHGAVLPTKEMVDAIWQFADLKLQPQPLQPGPQMTTKAYFNKHNDMIEHQIGERSFKLVAGHKKDIIRSQRQGRVTIYGWQRANGKPIQPVSSVHDDKYVDYSNCLRLVKIPS